MDEGGRREDVVEAAGVQAFWTHGNPFHARSLEWSDVAAEIMM